LPATPGAEEELPKLPMYSLEEDVVDQKERLVTRETVYLSRSVRKAFGKFAALLAKMDESDEEDSTAKLQAEAALCELELFAVEARKCVGKSESCERDWNECDTVEERLKGECRATETQVELLKAQLAQERLVRRRKATYEHLADAILRWPSSATSRSGTDAVSVNLAALDEEAARLRLSLAGLHRHSTLLVDALRDLQSGVSPFRSDDSAVPVVRSSSSSQQQHVPAFSVKQRRASSSSKKRKADEEAGEIAEDNAPLRGSSHHHHKRGRS